MNRIYLFGNATVDLCIKADFRLLEGGQQSQAQIQLQAGGGAPNVSSILAQLQSRVHVYCCAGDDPAGKLLQSLVPWPLHLVQGRATEISVISVEGERTIINQQGTAYLSDEVIDSRWERGSIVAFSYLNCCALSPLQVRYWLTHAKKKGCVTVGGINGVFRDEYRDIIRQSIEFLDFIIMNKREAEWLFERIGLPRLFDQFSNLRTTAVLTLGALGSLVFYSEGREATWLKPPKVSEPRSLGAGDAFLAGFTHALARGEGELSAGTFGHKIADNWVRGGTVAEKDLVTDLAMEHGPANRLLRKLLSFHPEN